MPAQVENEQKERIDYDERNADTQGLLRIVGLGQILW